LLAKNRKNSIKSISVHACEVTRSKGYKSTRNLGPINGIFINMNSCLKLYSFSIFIAKFSYDFAFRTNRCLYTHLKGIFAYAYD